MIKMVSEISETNSKFQSLITDLVLMRTHILLYFIVGVISLFSPYKWSSVICVVLIVILIFSGRKHNSRINKIRVSSAHAHRIIEKKNKEIHNFLYYDGTSEGDNQ